MSTATKAIGITLLGLCCATSSPGLTRYVSPTGGSVSPYTNWTMAAQSIQQAVDACVNDDEILVTNGTYQLSSTITVPLRLTLRSVNGRDVTKIDGMNSVRCLNLQVAGSTVEGFNIRRGKDSSGPAGVFVSWSSALRDCIVEYCDGGSSGGGARTYDNAIVEDCIFRYNQGRYSGGLQAQKATVRRCEFYGNVAEELAGGINASSGSLIDSCRIYSNEARGGAGVRASAATIRNCVIYNNSAIETGGGVETSPWADIENCTIVDNQAGLVGGGLNGRADVYNSIIYYNTAPAGYNWAQSYQQKPAYYSSCSFPLPPGLNNTDAVPQFRDWPGNDYGVLAGSPCLDTGTNLAWMGSALDLAGTTRILQGTVDLGCYEYATGELDVGLVATPTSGFVPFTPQFLATARGTNLVGLYYWWDFDDDGNWDLQGMGLNSPTHAYDTGAYDVRVMVSNSVGETATSLAVGAVEAAPAELYVSPVGGSVFPYADWADAATDPAMAVDLAVDGCKVWVAAGTYPMVQTLEMDRAITVEGAAPGDKPVLDGQNGIRCVRVSHPDAVLRNVEVANGSADFGGGILLAYGGTIDGCDIVDNLAVNHGGGVYMFRDGIISNSVVTGNSNTDNGASGAGVYSEFDGLVANCTFTTNVTGYLGGGFFAENGRPLVVDSIFASNWAWYGGGLSFDCSGTVERCTFDRNNVAGSGGAIYLENDGGTVRDCMIRQNRADSDAGGIWFAGYSRLLDSTIVSNQCGAYGGGMYMDYGGNWVENCLIQGNVAYEAGGGYINDYSAIVNCRVIGNRATDYTGGLDLFYGYATNCLIVNNLSGYEIGGVYLSDGAIHSCTIVGNTASNSYGGVYDSGGDGVFNSIVYSNNAPSYPNHKDDVDWYNSCTVPMPSDGTNNITLDPQLTTLVGEPYHLSDTSPCMDAGEPSGPPLDLNGIHRPLDGNADGTNRFDMGCFERASYAADYDGDGLSDGHEVYVYDCDPAESDSDRDGLTDGDEVVAGSNPADEGDAWGVQDVLDEPAADGVVIAWNTLTGRVYSLKYTVDLTTSWSNITGYVDLPGTGGLMAYTNQNPDAQHYYAPCVRLAD